MEDQAIKSIEELGFKLNAAQERLIIAKRSWRQKK